MKMSRWRLMMLGSALVLALSVGAWLVLPEMCPRLVLGSSPWLEPAARAAVAGHLEAAFGERVATAGSQAIPSLGDIMLSHKKQEVRELAAAQLEQLQMLHRYPAIYQFGMQALRDSNAHIRASGARMLIGDGSAEGSNALISSLHDTDVDAAAAACAVLGLNRNLAAVGPLRELLKAPEEKLRYYAVTALGRIGDSSIRGDVEALQKDPSLWVQHGAADALRDLDRKNRAN